MNAQAEQELRWRPHTPGDAGQRLELALAAADLGDWSWDATGDTFTLGRRAGAILGLQWGQPVSWNELRAVLHPDDRAHVRIEIELALASKADYRVELRLARPNGGIGWAAVMGRAVYADDGQLTGMIGVVQDVTERRRQEEALREETRALELLNETAARLGSELDLDGLVQAITDAGTQISGAKVGTFLYRTGDEHDPAFAVAALSGAAREAFAGFGPLRVTPLFEPTWRGEGPVRLYDVSADPRFGRAMPHRGLPSGHVPVRSYLAVPVASRRGEVIGGLVFGHPEPGMFTARTERLMLGIAAQAGIAIDNARLYERARLLADQRQQLLERERTARADAERICARQDEFLAVVSHELRSPLAAIQGWTHMLQRCGSEEEFQQGLEVIEQSIAVQSKLIEDLLDMRRVASGQLRLDVQTLDPRSFIEAALATVRPSAQQKNIEIRERLDPVVPAVRGDATRLHQVVVNLLSNAVKFTPGNGWVEVALRAIGGWAEITVADNGVGISPAFLPHVFERFRQAHGSAGQREGGLGLGLAIVKHLVELHGGRIRAESAGEGSGAAFVLRLPLADTPPPAS